MKLIENINNKCSIKIHENIYKVLSKSHYTTTENKEATYWKLKLEKGKILVVIPSDEIIYFGHEIEETNLIDLTATNFEFNGEVYKKMADGNQIYLDTVFGEPLEKNCTFADFENEKQTKVLSLAILDYNKRSDIFAEYIQEQDIEII